MVDWSTEYHFIRANPNFHNRPRYDYALVKVGEDNSECIIVHVLYIFRIRVKGEEHHMALVLPFDVPRQISNRNRDTELRLERIHPRLNRANSIIIDTNTIIRGVLLAEDRSSDRREQHVVSFTDQDIWMRMKTMRLLTHVGNFGQ